MQKLTPWICLLCLLAGAALAGCTLPATYAPLEVQNPAYTAAAETIAAQLTEIIAEPTSETPAAAQETQPEVEETLPPTSTPAPTRTPLPSDTPTPTQTGTNTPIPSATPVLPTATATAIVVSDALGDPDWEDNFQSSANWPLYTDEHVAMSIQNGLLSMIALKANPRSPYDAWMMSWPVLANFYLEATVTTGDCKGLDRYGLLARTPGFDPIRGYVFGFSCDGQYSLRIWDGKNYKNLIFWSNSSSINSGADQTNLIGLRAEGSKLSLFANGYLLQEIEDETYPSGYFGLFVGAALTDNFTVQVSGVRYWELP